MSIDFLVAEGPVASRADSGAGRRAADRRDQAGDQNEFSAKKLMITGSYRKLWLIYV